MNSEDHLFVDKNLLVVFRNKEIQYFLDTYLAKICDIEWYKSLLIIQKPIPMTFILIVALLTFMPAEPDRDDLLIFQSEYSVEETRDRLVSVLRDAGMNIITQVNHQTGAELVDLELRPTHLVLFGNPKAGTPLMQCSQLAGIDLPQKALIWEDDNGDVWLAFNNPEYLGERHGILNECESELSNAHTALTRFGNSAIE